MRTLAELKNKHEAKTCWIFGTGPSLDTIPLDEITGPRIFLNRAAFVLPHSKNESYWFVMDDAWDLGCSGKWTKTLDDVHRGISDMLGVFRNPLGARGSRNPAPKKNNLIYWDGTHPQYERPLTFTRDEIAEQNVLFTWHGGACSAVHLAWFMGCHTVKFAGIDGNHGYANIVKGEYAAGEGAGGWGYISQRNLAINVAHKKGLNIIDYSEVQYEKV